MKDRRTSSLPTIDKTSDPAPSMWSRRQFLCTATVAGFAAPFFVSCSSTQPGPKPVSANGKLHHACIGVGGMGWVDLQNFLQHKRVQIVALCDVDDNSLAGCVYLDCYEACSGSMN